MRDWSDEIIAQLIAKSNEPAILRWTPRDHSERFTNSDVAKAWHEKSPRVTYALTKGAELAGFLWFGESPHPGLDADYTLGIRLYDIARGQGIAASFLHSSEEDFRRTSLYDGGIWLETDLTNTVARHIYEKQGYQEVSRDARRVVMLKLGVKS